MPRVVNLPDRGRLIVATDLQGNLADFLRVERLFLDANAADPDGATLVVTGDLVHGPEIPEAHWPDYLGSYFFADSAGVLERAQKLAEAHPGRVFYLLGNHEHAHVGGPIVSKFFPDEAERLESLMTDERTTEIRAWIASWPIMAVAPSAGILLVHGAPNAPLRSRDDVEAVRLYVSEEEGFVDPMLAELLWARSTTPDRARAFLDAIHADLNVCIYGHDVARQGFAIDHEPLLCISTSFGCFDGDKLYLEWDLTRHVESASALAAEGLRALWPDASPVYRDPELTVAS